MVASEFPAPQIPGVRATEDTSTLPWQPGWGEKLVPDRITYLLRLKNRWNGAFSINCTGFAIPLKN
jgi:hypothetical protein